MKPSTHSAAGIAPTIPNRVPRRRIRNGLLLTLLGLIVFLVGARPDAFGLDISPVIGFIQIAVFVVGLAFMAIGGYIALMSLWKGQEISIAADIGQRLVATGYVVAGFVGMADVFGFGSHIYPMVPYFGIWQQIGVEFGQFLMAAGFLLMIPFRPTQPKADSLPGESTPDKPTAANIS